MQLDELYLEEDLAKARRPEDRGRAAHMRRDASKVERALEIVATRIQWLWSAHV